MGIEDIKRWQWTLIGILVGFGLGWVWSGGETTVEGRNFDQRDFEIALITKAPSTQQPVVRSIVVHPPTVDYAGKNIQLVTFKRLQRGTKSNRQYWTDSYLYAAVPFQTRLGNEKFATVRDYLIELPKRTSGLEVDYKYGWWTQRPAQLAIWTGGALLLIGGVWPTLLGALVGAGLGGTREKTKKEDYFDRFSHAPEAAKVEAGPLVGDAEMRRLDEMNRALEQNLAAAGVSQTVSPAPDDDAQVAERIRKLEDGPLEQAAIPKNPDDDDEIEVKGEFYPVLIHHKKHHEDGKDAHHEGNGKAH